MKAERDTMLYPNVLASTKMGDPMGPRQAPAFVEFQTNNQETVVRGYVYWYIPEQLTECPRHGGPWGEDETCPECTNLDGTPKREAPALIIELDDEDEGPDTMDINIRVRRNDGLIYEGTRASQKNLEES